MKIEMMEMIEDGIGVVVVVVVKEGESDPRGGGATTRQPRGKQATHTTQHNTERWIN